MNLDAEMGPIVTPVARDRITGYIDVGVKEGAKLLVDGRGFTGGAAGDGCDTGFWLGGTLFDHVKPDMRIYKEEIFGRCWPAFARKISAKQYSSSTTTSSATALRASRAMAMLRASLPAASKSAWSASTCRFRCRWPGTASAAGSRSMFGDMHAYGEEGVRFYTKQKSIMQRWPESTPKGAEFAMPTSK